MKLIEFDRIFLDEDSCVQYFRNLREKSSVTNNTCENTNQMWNRCNKYVYVISLHSGIVMQASKFSLMYGFTVIYLLTLTKNTFSAVERQYLLSHKRYQPILEIMHKLRIATGVHCNKYVVKVIELDEDLFTSEDLGTEEKYKFLRRDLYCQKKSKVLVMVESEKANSPKEGMKDRRAYHIKMVVVDGFASGLINREVVEYVDKDFEILIDATGYNRFKETLEKTIAKVALEKDAPKVLPEVHIVISNTKSLLEDMYYRIKEVFQQNYFCYKFNKKYLRDKIFDRLMVCAVSYEPSFEYRLYAPSHIKKSQKFVDNSILN